MARTYPHQIKLVELLQEFPAPLVAEVGVYCGHTSEYLLKHHPGLRLVGFDLWTRPPSDHPWRTSGGDMLSRKLQSEMDSAKAKAASRTLFAAERRQFIQSDTVEAAGAYPDDYFDLVFIDAAHYYEAVTADMTAWFPKVKAGGWFTGHDYGGERFKGCTRAVDDWFGSRGISFEVFKEGQLWFSRKA